MRMFVRMSHKILLLLLAFFVVFQVDCSLNFSSSFHHSLPSCQPQQSSSLLQFKNTILLYDSCPDYRKTNSWNQSTDCCLWEGVSCHKLTGLVIGISLRQSCLYGTSLVNSSRFLPQSLQWLDVSYNFLDGPLLENSSTFKHLHGLQQLNLSNNGFNGSISLQLFNQLVSLTHLDLSRCFFSSLIPHEIALLSNLVSLDLSENTVYQLRFDSQGFDMFARNLTKLKNLVLDWVDMSGVTLSSFLNMPSSLERLSLIDCKLHGEFPSQVFGLPNLRYVNLYWNENVTGYLPRTNLSVALELFRLETCRFTGSIPASFGNLTQIMVLDLSNNSFGGEIPSSLFDLTRLTYLDLSNNRLEGTLPNHFDRLQFLQYLSLGNNLISGRIPSWLFTLPFLSGLDLSNNKLTGSLDYFHKPNSSFRWIDLSFNNIQGPIPDFFFEFVNLTQLSLSSNNFSGVFKSNKLAKLKVLESLDLSQNSLLSLGAGNNDFNYSSTSLTRFSFSSCSLTQFPSFLRTSNLRYLYLSNNKISGSIAKWEAEGWANLKVLDLSFNFLTSFEHVPGSLLSLDIRSNLLQGPILSTFFNLPNLTYIQFLSISKNKLSGNIPNSICRWEYFTVLDLSENNLSGTIPPCLGNNTYVEFINLGMNNFYGEIPDSFIDNSLTNLLLNDNQLEGLIPRSLANCSYLTLLNLRNNNLVDTFPTWLASLSSLKVLILSFNRLFGSIPSSMATSYFSTLRIIDVSHNEFTGHLPIKLFQNLTAMKHATNEKNSTEEFSFYLVEPGIDNGGFYRTYVTVTSKRMEMKLEKILTIFISMDFSSNLFSGQIPKEVGELVSLQALNFSNNNLSGAIPPSLGNMVALESLDISSNNLSGRIPSQLTNLTFLEVLDLSGNDLVGPIPTGKQFDTFDNNSYRDNLGLCGLPMSKQCSNKEGPKPPPPMHLKHESSTIDIPFIWKVVMMGYGCGVVLGLSMGYIVFTIARPWWFVRKVERDWQTTVTNWIRRNRRRN